MHAKLILTLEKETIDKAKAYAKKQGVSLSQIVEGYLNEMTDETAKEVKDAPITRSLKGSFKSEGEFDYKEHLQESLIKKYINNG